MPCRGPCWRWGAVARAGLEDTFFFSGTALPEGWGCLRKSIYVRLEVSKGRPMCKLYFPPLSCTHGSTVTGHPSLRLVWPCAKQSTPSKSFLLLYREDQSFNWHRHGLQEMCHFMSSSIKHGMYDGITCQMESGVQISFWETKNLFWSCTTFSILEELALLKWLLTSQMLAI